MGKHGRLIDGGVSPHAAGSLRAPRPQDEAKRLFEAHLETFQQAPEADFLLKRYFFTLYVEKKYLQDNVFFIPRADFLWFFKYYLDAERDERIIELKKRSTSKAETEIDIATIHIRTYYTYEQEAAEILYTRTFAEREGEEFILKNTTDAVRQVEQLLADFRSDRVTQQPY
jgi:hypothetical protein